MKRLSGQNTLLALSVIAVFTISGCFLNNSDERKASQQEYQHDIQAAQTASVASVK